MRWHRARQGAGECEVTDTLPQTWEARGQVKTKISEIIVIICPSPETGTLSLMFAR